MNFKVAVLVILAAIKLNAQEEKVHTVLEAFESYPKVRDFTINSNSDEAYFTVQSPNEELSGIFKIVKINGHWKKAQLASFSGQFKDLEPFLSPNGLQLYFASNRPLQPFEVTAKDFDIWMVERKTASSEWSVPINLGKPVNTEHNEFYPAITISKTIYFTSDRPTAKGKDDIFKAKWVSESYEEIISLSEAINTEGYEFNSYVAPDESFMIFSGYARKDGLGSGDMYISYNTEGEWSTAKNLGAPFNSKQMDYCPFVDWGTKTLYFTSKRTTLQAKKRLSTEQFLDAINAYSNGLSRIYKIDMTILLEDLKSN